jgi:hypothetical protein
MYRSLNADKVVNTIAQLNQRIAERFPKSGLSNVCADLLTLSQQTSSRITEVAKPHWGLRSALGTVSALSLGAIALFLGNLIALEGTNKLTDVVQGLDAAMNLVIILSGAAFFVSTLETRWKRRRAQAALHELRSIIHVIDMHQLTKDPSFLGGASTSSSPERTLTTFELTRYLDYCSEMLSLAAKLAALYAEKLSDPAIIDTVGDIERLTSHLSSKIWQKITLTQAADQNSSNVSHAPNPSLAPSAPAVSLVP